MSYRSAPISTRIYLLSFLVLAVCSMPLYAECCFECLPGEQPPTFCDEGVCQDGSCSTPCCGLGGCNAFCCNCDGGCRMGNACSLSSAIDRFKSIDKNSDDRISLSEFRDWAKTSRKGYSRRRTRAEFSKLDSGKDEFIQPSEFDKDLGVALSGGASANID